ncbi:MAG: PspC domain-containing protein [Prevotellaceae bacterium]|jgi:phage shock protein PspC (stress-responsive transcriptional regulator)|nr:PspC domain-containing protein [Prevotellaceae bacterium]
MKQTKKLTRPRTGRMLTGVCAGLANFFELDPTLVRVGYVLLTLLTAFAGVMAYIILTIVIPQEQNRLIQS